MKLKTTWHYSQPDFYHFNSDSIELAAQVSSYLANNTGKSLTALDLCCGCGVVGLEVLIAHEEMFSQFSFCELQNEFQIHLQKNIADLAPKVNTLIHMESFLSLDVEKVDLIVCNPPYFDQNAARLPKSTERLLCRFLDGYSWKDLYQFILDHLSETGVAFLSIPEREYLIGEVVSSIDDVCIVRVDGSMKID
jgi:tRNA1(Val) A37 N6-methylase TrmN6